MTTQWHIYQGLGKPNHNIEFPAPPPWRDFKGEIHEEYTPDPDIQLVQRLGIDADGNSTFIIDDEVKDMVNAAIYLRRPLIVTGSPGVGKSTLADAVAYELGLGAVLRWSITSRSTLQDALYRYDAIGRLQEAKLIEVQRQTTIPDIGKYIRLGPLGTALLPRKRPRVLLINEIDKSDIDLPNDLLDIFEEGEFEIPELARLSELQEEIEILPYGAQQKVKIRRGRVNCHAFPIIVITSNGERELPAPLRRRCLSVTMHVPNEEQLAKIVNARFRNASVKEDETRAQLIRKFFEKRDGEGHLATDQLFNAIYLVSKSNLTIDELVEKILQPL